MAQALVTGSGDRVSAVAGLLAEAGHEVRTATGLAELDALGDIGGIEHYVQLPAQVRPVGETLVGRVRSFLTDGLLARYTLVERLLPAFAQRATIVLVSGNTPTEAMLPDDDQSRLALLHVLAHAVRAELAQHGVQVTVANGARSDRELVRFALRGGADPTVRLTDKSADVVTDEQYQDWRTETMGLRSGLA